MNIRAAVDLLKQIPLFAGVDEAHLQTLIFSSDELVVPQGRTMFEAGDPATSAIVITSGEAVVHDGQTGSVLALAGPGSMFGEQSMIAGLPRQVTVNAKTEVEAIVVEQAVFMRLCSEFPEVGMQVLDVLSRQLGESSDALADVQEHFQVRPVDELLKSKTET
jgi:CRP/FNR family transcriptional regulator, cyclic AMP receptor protein